MLIKLNRIIVQTLFFGQNTAFFENENKNYEIKYMKAFVLCFSFALNFSIVFIKIELNEFWWFFVRNNCYSGDIHAMYILLRKMKNVQSFPPIKKVIVESDVKKWVIHFYRSHPFLETQASYSFWYSNTNPTNILALQIRKVFHESVI